MVSYNALSLAEVLQHQYPLHLCVYCRNVDTICMKQTYFHCVSMVCRDTPTNMFFFCDWVESWARNPIAFFITLWFPSEANIQCQQRTTYFVYAVNVRECTSGCHAAEWSSFLEQTCNWSLPFYLLLTKWFILLDQHNTDVAQGLFKCAGFWGL